MNIFIRADASINIGTGHIMRCLSLADYLTDSNLSRNFKINSICHNEHEQIGKVHFVCRDEPGNLINLIKQRGYDVFSLPAGIDLEVDRKLTEEILQKQTSDLLIIDHYEITYSWESSLRKFVNKIMVIDDLADRKHNCDILLNQNFTPHSYKNMVPEHCILLLGPSYTLLRPEFSELRKKVHPHTGEVKRILVFMGGSDPSNETSKAIHAIQMLNNSDIITDVVIGKSNPNRNEIETLASKTPNTICHFNVNNMAEMMLRSDLCIGAGGTTTWERCCLGLPTVVIAIAENQKIMESADFNFIIYLGWYEELYDRNIYENLQFLLKHKAIIRKLSSNGLELVDGCGVARVVNYLNNNFIITTVNRQTPAEIIPPQFILRYANADDCKSVWELRNNAETRKYFFNPSPISLDEHNNWFFNTLNSPDKALLVSENSEQLIGVLRYDFVDKKAYISIYIDPKLTGRGLGTNILKMGSEWLRKNHPEVKEIVAEIMQQNRLSVNAFIKAGFKESFSTYTCNL